MYSKSSPVVIINDFMASSTEAETLPAIGNTSAAALETFNGITANTYSWNVIEAANSE